jgi:hypothetical protein
VNSEIQVEFDRQTCAACPVRSNCTHSQKAPRTLKLRPRDEYEALNKRRQEQQTQEFRKSTGVERGLKVLFPKECVNSIYDERDIVGLLKLIYSMLPQLVP